MRNVKILAFCCFFFIILSGCWDKKEINDLAVILSAGIDKLSDDSIQLTVQIRTPAQGTSGSPGSTGQSGSFSPSIEVKQAKGETIFDALEQLQEKTPRELFWGHNQAIFISEEIAKEGIREHIDFFARYFEARLRTHVFITKENIMDLMNVVPLLGSSAGEITKEIAHFEAGINMDIRKVLVMANTDIETIAIPWLELDTTDPTVSYRVNGIAIFNKGKMIDYIDDKMTRGVLWFRNEIEKASVTLKPEGVEKGHISFDLINSSTKVNPIYNNGKWKIKLEITSEDDIVQNGTKLNVDDFEVRKKLEKQLEEEIRTRINDMLEIVQKDLSADILGVGPAIHRKYPKKWNEIKDKWSEVFRDMEIEIDINVVIKRPGSSTKPQGIPEEKAENK